MKTQRNGQVGNSRQVQGEKTHLLTTTTKPYAIILADDHPIFRRSIKRLIEESPNLEVVGEAGDGFEALDLLKGFIPDLIILDLSMPKCGGMEASRLIKRVYPTLKVLILTMHRNEVYRQRARDLGVDGYLLKENAADELNLAIFSILAGKPYFSPLYSKFEPSDQVAGPCLPE